MELVCVGASWGGLVALEKLLTGLPPSFDTPIVVAQHRAVDSGSGALGRLLAVRSGLDVCEAGDKDRIEPGRIYLAPPDYHLLVEPGSLHLSTEGHVQYSRPSIDVLFESAADSYGERLVGVILTGANSDGAYGLGRVKRRGGVTIVQDPDTAERREMPAAAIAAGAAQHVLPVEGIAQRLSVLAGTGAKGKVA
jgi:two-component system chemotaxis response regulator CheB